MEDKEPLTIQEIVERLNNINKDEMRERKFFQEVLSVINAMKDFDLTEEDFEKISATLKQIGCVDYDTWDKEKKKLGFSMSHKPIKEGASEGLLSAGVTLVEQFLSDYNKAIISLERMTEGGEKSGWLQTWLRNSQKVLIGVKSNSDSYFEFNEPELPNRDELSDREKEEKETQQLALRKEDLTAEILSLQQQIEEQEIKEATLRNGNIREELQHNDLEEK